MRSIMAMLRPRGADAGALYDAVVAEARRPAWYREGAVADSMDGRFAVLSSLTALTILRLEDGGEDALASRVDRWREARAGNGGWDDAVRFSVYRDSLPPAETAVTFSTEALRRFDEGLGGQSDREVIEGRIG